jgi:hypothetical protein
MKVDRIAARRVCGVCGEEQTSVGVNCRWKARDVLESHCRDHATELTSAALDTAASASDNVTPYVRVSAQWDVSVVCVLLGVIVILPC